MNPTARSCLILLGCLAASQTVFAHAKLVSASPSVSGSTGTSTRALNLNFSEAISGKLSGVVVKPAGGGALPATVNLGKAGKSLSLVLHAPLKPGVYSVIWHAVASDDGHRTGGSYTFIVR